MNKPDYFAPSRVDEALRVLEERGHEACIIAGGTDLLPRIRTREIMPALFIDLRLLSLKHIDIKDNQIHLGACLTHTDIISSNILSKQLPALIEACREIAGPTIRNRGTLGGNLANASPAADTVPPLMVYDAHLVLVNNKSKRIVPIAEFFTGPGQTVLKNDELLTEVIIPLVPKNTKAKFIKLGRRRAMAIALVSVGVRLTLNNKEEVAQARIALGSVAPLPIRVEAAEALLKGNILSKDLIAEASWEASKAASPISDIRASASYRKRMVEVLVRRGLSATWASLKGARSNVKN